MAPQPLALRRRRRPPFAGVRSSRRRSVFFFSFFFFFFCLRCFHIVVFLETVDDVPGRVMVVVVVVRLSVGGASAHLRESLTEGDSENPEEEEREPQGAQRPVFHLLSEAADAPEEGDEDRTPGPDALGEGHAHLVNGDERQGGRRAE